MHPVISRSSRLLAACLTLGSLALVSTGCSSRARVARQLAAAERDFQASRYDEAEIEFKNVLQVDAQNAAAIGRLGAIFHEQGRDARALPFLARAKELQPADLPTRLRFGLVSLSTGNPKDARAEAVALLDLLPENEHVPLLLVESSVEAELADAGQRLRALSATRAKTAPVLVGLGQLDLRQNRLKEAESHFLAALVADPKSLGAQSGLAMLYWSQKNLSGADMGFRRAAESSPPRSPKRLQYAQFKLQTGDIAGGCAMLEDISRATPDYLPVWVWLAELAAMDKKYAESEVLLGRALARDPLNAEALLLGARVRMAKGETDKGLAEFERLAVLFPKSAQINYQLGLAWVAKGETGKALARLAQAPEMPAAVLAIGEIQLRTRNVAAAIATLRPLAQQHPELTAARILLAEALRAHGDVAEASALYTQLESEHPRDGALAFAHGVALLQQNQPDAARAAFVRTRELAPGHAGALERLVELDLAEKRYVAARERVTADLALAPRAVSSHLLLAHICLAQGDNPGAELALKRVIELQPDSPVAQFQLARIYLASQEPEKALANLEATVAKGPPNLTALLLLGVIRDERKAYAGAREAYEKALLLDPKSALVLNNLAFLYAERFGQIDQARELAQRARAVLPQEPRIADTLGWIMAKQKQYGPAVALLQESASRMPDDADVQFHLGVVSYQLGDEQTARTAFQRSLAAQKESAGAVEARATLAILELDPKNLPAGANTTLEKRLLQSPDDSGARLRLGAWCERHAEPEKAAAHYRAVLEKNPRQPGALLGLARIYAAKPDLPKALETAKAARAAAPNDPEVAHVLGRLAFASGDYRWADSLLGEAARLRPDDPEILFDRAEAAYSVGRVAEAEGEMRAALESRIAFSREKPAREWLALNASADDTPPTAETLAHAERLARANPPNVRALMLLAAHRERTREPGEARRAYEDVLSRYPDFAPAQKNLTLLYARGSSDDRKAAALAAKARLSFPSDPAVAGAGGMIAYRLGDFAKAATLLEESVGKTKADGELMYYLGMAQSRANRAAAGRLSLQRALELGLKDPQASEARKSLAAAK